MSTIPKVIHYCWFGGKPLPKSARRCIASWRKFLPDHEIREWNESNFDVNMIPYTAEAYAAKKYAFVSDFARFWVLHEYGGIYFDTDVEVIAPMDDILERGAYMGMEAKTRSSQRQLYVNPGIGFACEAGNTLWAYVINVYKGFLHYTPEIQGTVCTITTKALAEMKIHVDGSFIESALVTIYPADYFCPQAMMGAPIYLTERTRSIHHFDATWLPWYTRLRRRCASLLPEIVLKMLRNILIHD